MSEEEKEENKSPEDNENEREPTSSTEIIVEDIETTEKSTETVSRQSTGTDVAVKANTVICIQGKAGADHICFVEGVPNEKVIQELTEKQVLKYEKPRFWVYTTDDGWSSYLPSPSDYLPSSVSAYLPSPSDYLPALPWPFSSPEDARTAAKNAREAAKKASVATKNARTQTRSTVDAYNIFSSSEPTGPPKGPHLFGYGHIPTGPALAYAKRGYDRNKILRLTFLSLMSMILVVIGIIVAMNRMPFKDQLTVLDMPGASSAAICMGIMFGQYIGFCMLDFTHACPVGYLFLFITASCTGWVVSVCTVFIPHIAVGVGMTVFVVFFLCSVLSYTSIDFTTLKLHSFLFFFTIVVGTLIGYAMHTLISKFDLYRAIAVVVITLPLIMMMLTEMCSALNDGTFELGENEDAYLAFLVFTCYIDLIVNVIYSILRCINRIL